jgi:hypothetical protein
MLANNGTAANYTGGRTTRLQKSQGMICVKGHVTHRGAATNGDFERALHIALAEILLSESLEQELEAPDVTKCSSKSLSLPGMDRAMLSIHPQRGQDGER